MSYTTNIKNEILNNEYNKTEQISELSAIININGEIENNSISLYTENIGVSRRIYKLLKDIFNIEINITKEEINRLNKNFIIHMTIKEDVEKILKTLDLYDYTNNTRKYKPSDYICGNIEEKKSYLRGAFLICGSVNDPKTSRYHLEFIIENKITANYINDLLQELNFNSKILKREKHYMVYLKESERISDFIKLLNAYNSLFYYEDIRIYRDHKNMVNRLNNCEQANLEKSLNTSNKQLEIINYLKDNDYYSLLDEKTIQVCEYRLKYPEESYQTLADILTTETDKKVSKSYINHHFRKINEVYDRIINLRD